MSCNSRILFVLLSILSWAALPTSVLRAAVFQYAVPVKTSKPEPSQAFLWIPPGSQQVRGVVMAGMTLMEREFVKDPQIRKACAESDLGIVFLKCGLGAADVQRVLDDLAAASGYRELPGAPLLFVGHSAGGPQAKALAIRMADRCIGLVQYRGGVPGGAAPGDIVPAGVPALMMIGQFDEFGGTMRNDSGQEPWERGRNLLVAYRAANEANVASVVVEPGAGHFAWSDRNASYLALWIRKAAAARIPAERAADSGGSVKCKVVDPKSGWLTDPAVEKAAVPEPAPFGKFAGDRAKANWHFDEELARATVAYHHPSAGGFGKKDQFIKWSDDTWVEVGVRHFFTKIDWVGDGQTFEVHPVFADAYPATQPDGSGPRWAEAGKPAGHAPGPIVVKPVSGAVVATTPNQLRIQFDALAPVSDGGRVTFLAYHAGDADYRHTEQVGMLPRGFNGFKDGRDQTVTFPPVGDLREGDPPVELKATSDSGLPVEYYVAYGPVMIENGRLVVAEMPSGAKSPVAAGVVAYQFGRGIAPLVRTAKPVEQTLQVQPRKRAN